MTGRSTRATARGRSIALLAAWMLAASSVGLASAPVAAAAAPGNDYSAGAVVLDNGDLPYGPVVLDTTDATTEPDEPNYSCVDFSNGTANTVWYRYTTATAGAVIVDTAGSTFDTKIAVYQGASLGSLTNVTCAHEEAGFGTFAAFHAAVGLTYWIQVGGDQFDGSTNPYGSLHLAIRAQSPANDFSADAVQLTNTSLPYGPVTMDTTRATTEPDEPNYSCVDFSNGTANTVWYRYTTASAGAVIVDTAGSTFDTKIAVYQGASLGSLSNVTCAHEDAMKGQKASFFASVGLTYWIQVGGDSFDGTTPPHGSLHVSVTDTLAPAVGAPVCTQVKGLVQSTTGVRLSCTWAATPKGAPIASYAVRRATDGGTPVALETITTGATSVTRKYTLGSGHSYRLSVLARDTQGRTSGWSTGGTLRPVAYEQGSSKVAYRGTWTTPSGASFHGGSARYARSSGASATFRFTGRSVAWVTRQCRTCGKARIYVNGVYSRTIDLYSSTTIYRKTIWTRAWSTSATRSIKVVVVGTAGRPRVEVDAFMILR